jgi:hypothetical protein
MFFLFSRGSPLDGFSLGVSSRGQGPPRETGRNLASVPSTSFFSRFLRISRVRMRGR